MKTLGVKGKLLCQGPLPLGFICGSKLPRSGTGVKLGRSRTWRETPISNYPPVILRFSPLKSPPPPNAFFPKLDSFPEKSCVKKSDYSRIPPRVDGMGWGGGYSFLPTGLAAGTLDWLAARHKGAACTDVTLRPSAGGGPGSADGEKPNW